ncbi:hypothetical protein [Massilia sp. TSP1-1-2]|uniref:hypothetical protein n=1 Tax=unclassified Massilia TaxID=2609279 RepID=UPI003CF1BE55
MTFKRLFPFALLLTMFLVACGGGDGPTLGAFPATSKAEGDAPFTLTAPSSKGPGAFTFSSSNLEVATIAGNTVTIVGPGTSTITAQQAAMGSYNASSTSAVLTVSMKACIAPATRQNNTCTAPATSATPVTFAGRTWMGVTFVDTWANANNYCTTTTINGTKGWRMPTELELSDLRAAGAMAGHGWTLSRTWSSTAGLLAAQRKGVRLSDGAVSDDAESTASYVACVI